MLPLELIATGRRDNACGRFINTCRSTGKTSTHIAMLWQRRTPHTSALRATFAFASPASRCCLRPCSFRHSRCSKVLFRVACFNTNLAEFHRAF